MSDPQAILDEAVDHLVDFHKADTRRVGRAVLEATCTTIALTAYWAWSSRRFVLVPFENLWLIVPTLAIEVMILAMIGASSRRASRSAVRALRLFEQGRPEGNSGPVLDKRDWVILVQLLVQWQTRQDGENARSEAECLAIHFGHAYRVKIFIQGVFVVLAELLAVISYILMGPAVSLITSVAILAAYATVYPTHARLIRWAGREMAAYLESRDLIET